MHILSKNFIMGFLLFGFLFFKSNAQQISLESPNNSLNIKINITEEISFHVFLNKKTVQRYTIYINRSF